ncbi:MAG: hypothetical protein F6K03_06740 [Kamptonema sp. SIO4C4]|nr:hypothetical protein [Kamptonema sp. SIO4C4]
MREQLTQWLDRILVLDVFVVLLGFAWFAVALIGKSAGIPLGWEVWYKLWQPVFNPAISILIAGAILSWAIKKIGQKLDQQAK